MPRVTYIEFNGTEHVVDVAAGLSVMEGAIRHQIPGIDGDCGGACACATCHVYVDPAWSKKIPPKSELEHGMLDFAVDPTSQSRLSCQIEMTPELDGLTVRLPEHQY
ncbi:MAG: 2Fe-2S iron-sulfur cluster binding domain-containing protein [Proteobacteria bacterium]|nr:2Fe-2S iron-sulfur cluster binding domain-containing protein [Pseudomonadota bacterium]